MKRYSEGDEVRFLGDPEAVTYEVIHVNMDGSVDLRSPAEQVIEYAPTRLLEPAPEPIRDGSLWRDPNWTRVFVLLGGGSFVTYVRAGSLETWPVSADWFRENMTPDS